MSDSTIKEIILKVNGDDAQKELNKINDKLEDTKKKRKELTDAAKGRKMTSEEEASLYRLDKEIQKCNKQLGRMAAGADEVTRTLHNLEQATPKQLQRTLRSLTASLSGPHMKRGSKEWQAIQEKIKAVKEEIEKVKQEQREAMSMSDRFAEWGQKWMGIAEVVETTAEAFSGLKMKAAEAIDAYLEMDEAQVAVKKYTGLASDAVKELNEEFKKMDTRTPRERLNALAADAGRLGITSKEAILEFVDAANMINVALGEDLGEDAVKNIGKLAELFGDDKKMGLKQAMISTGSVINDLAQSSSANEGYIMDFTARLAGMAKQAGMSQAEVMALASIMDQSMVNAEEGSTALMKVIQQIYREPEKMAAAAGLQVKEFTDLVKTDANEALLQFATAVSKLGGMDKIAPMLGELSLTGAGVSKAIATLANQVDKVRAAQTQATEAFRTGASVVNEYNTANNSQTAIVEKNKKKIEDLRIELGERLQPIFAAGLSTTSEMIRISTVLLDFTAKHIASIAAVTTVLAVYTATMNAAVISEKAHALWLGICTKAQTLWAAKTVLGNLTITLFTKGLKAARLQFAALNTTMKANVIGLVTAGISMLVVALVELAGKSSKAKKEQDNLNAAMNRISDSAAESTKQEITRVKELVRIINSNAYSYKFKKQALEQLQKIAPAVQGSIAKEISLTEADTKAVQDYIKQLELKAKAQAYYAELENAEKKIVAAQIKEDQEQFKAENIQDEINNDPKYKSRKGKVSLAVGGMFASGFQNDYDNEEQNTDRVIRENQLQQQNKVVEAAKQERLAAEKLRDGIKKSLQSHSDVSGAFDDLILKGTGVTPDLGGGGGGGNGGGSGTEDDDALKKAIEKLKAETEQKKLIKRLEYNSGIIDAQTYSQALLDIDINHFEIEKRLYDQNSNEYLTAENNRLEAIKKSKENSNDFSLHQIEVETQEEQKLLMKKYASGLMREEEYQEQLTQLQLEYLRKRAAFLLANDPGSQEQQEAQAKYQEALDEDQFNKKKAFMERVAAFEREYQKKSNAKRKKEEIDFLKELLDKKVITQEQYQEYLEQINAKYSSLSNSTDPVTASIINIGEAIANLQENLRLGQTSWQDYAAVAVASLGMISALTNSASQLMQANIDYETAKINKKYDAEISAAGRNSKKAKKLEEKKQAEIAKVKNKYAGKAMAMQMASAVAQTAISAINAYSSAAAIPLVGHIIAPIAAATAIAAGMIQIATIKKQHQAQTAGYYAGGYTGGRDYRKEAGVVHEGEFVANHNALANPNIVPVLDLIDYAQRNNTVASLSSEDVSRAVAAPQQTASILSVSQPPVVVQETSRTSAALEKLNQKIDDGIYSIVVIDGPDGLDNQMKKYKKLKNR